MTADFWIQLISNNMFPIAACIALALFFNKVNDNYRSDIKELTQSHKDEMHNMTEALNNNTAAINELKIMIKAREE